MCESNNPCCEPIRSESSFCWESYDALGDAVESACYTCCDEPKLVGQATPEQSGLPKTIQCSSVDNPYRMCKENSCCSNPRSTSDYCVEQYDLYPEEMEEICYYCCSTPKDIGSRRGLRSSDEDETTEEALDEDFVPEGAKVMEVGGKRFLLRQENFEVEEHEEDEHAYFNQIYSEYQRRNLTTFFLCFLFLQFLAT
jgi:hypothetical protein